MTPENSIFESMKGYLRFVASLLIPLLLFVMGILSSCSHSSKNQLENIPQNNDSLYIYAKEVNNVSLLNKSLKNYIKSTYRQRNWEEFFKYCDEHLLVTAGIGDTTSYARTLEYKGAYFKILNKIDSAYYYYTQSLKLYEQTNDSLNIGFGLLNLAIIQKNLRNYPISIYNLKKSLLYMEGKASPRRISSSHNTIAINYNNMNRFDSALVYNEKAIRLRELLKNQAYLVQSLNNIGKVHERKGNYTKALQYYNEALTYDAILEKYPRTKATIIDNKAYSLLLLDSKGYDVEADFLKALRIREKENDAYGKTVSYIHLAKFYQKIGKGSQANDFIKKAQSIASEIKDHEDLLRILELQIVLYDGEEEMKALMAYRKIRDSLDFSDKEELERLFAVAEKVTQQKMIIESKEEALSDSNKVLWWLGSSLAVVLLLIISILCTKKKKEKKMSKNLSIVKQELQAKREEEEKLMALIDSSESFQEYFAKRYDLDHKGMKLVHLIVEGKTQAEQADAFNISENTLKTYKRTKFYPNFKLGWDVVNKQRAVAEIYQSELKKYSVRSKRE
jgi:tetratricopeptide (TPR) repeat protein